MKKLRNIALFSLMFCFMFGLVACGTDTDSGEKKDDIEIVQKDEEVHYLKFMENNAEVLRIVVLKNETYEDLLPYFPTLTEEEGYIKYWDGDYVYTSYSHDNQFQVYKSDVSIIEIYAYMKKIN